MDLYVIIHHHRHGVTTYLVRSDHIPGEDEVIRECDIDFEPDREEYIDIEQCDDIKELQRTMPA